MPCEIVIKLKNSDKSTTYKFLEYETVTTDDSDPVIRKHVDASYKQFQDEVEKEQINIKLMRS